MSLFFQHGWIFCIVVTMLNYVVFKQRTKSFMDENQDLQPGYQKMFKALLIYGNLPWLIMALGDLTAQTQTIFDFFNPGSFNPIVLLFHAYMVVFWLLCFGGFIFKREQIFWFNIPDLFTSEGSETILRLHPCSSKYFSLSHSWVVS